MDLPCYQVDAFTRRAFGGNPAAVCPLERWLPDATMQAIAAENNLSETAFFVPAAAAGGFGGAAGAGADFALRWFTPTTEVELCGHATLATAFVLMTLLEPARTQVTFAAVSGPLVVTRTGDAFTLDFPSRPPAPVTDDPAVARALGAAPRALLRARDLVAVFDRAEDVRALAPDMGAIAALPDTFAVIATAPGTGADADVAFVSRFFAPAKGVPEDPVTGSAHCTLIPYWAARLGRPDLLARQVSARVGTLSCRLASPRVFMTGHAVLTKTATFHLPADGLV